MILLLWAFVSFVEMSLQVFSVFFLSVRLVITRVSTLSRVDLPELDAFLHARCCHDALIGVGLTIAGTQRLFFWGACLRWAIGEGLAGDRLYPALCIQTVFTVFTWVCGNSSIYEYTVCYSTYLYCNWNTIKMLMLFRHWAIEQLIIVQKHLCPSFDCLWKNQYLGK